MNGRTKILVTACWLAWTALAGAAELPDEKAWDIDIPYHKFVLENGLTLIVHEDQKAPIAAVNLWYHVGSKDEPEGKSGFAHLFEHLMFNGSEHFNEDYFQALERVGATDLNGTTNSDRTNYFQNVPTSALDVVLWLESDRMGHLLGAIDQEKLDEQRGVVQNERRQNYENQPYNIAWLLFPPNTYPADHPYSHPTIGSMKDLDAASLEDVREWFKTYYGTANAVIVVAGDVEPDRVREKVEKYFGGIPSGPPLEKHRTWIAKREGTRRQIVQDRVPQPRIHKVWNVPPWGATEFDYLDLVSDILSVGKTSRLYRRLVYEDQIATDVAAFLSPREIGSQFHIQATARPGEDLNRVEAAIDEELTRLLKEGPTADEVGRVKTGYLSRFIRGIERVGGFGGKSDILAMNEVYAGSPDFYKTTLERIRKAEAEDLRSAAEHWLSGGVYILEIHPFPDFKVTETNVDRSRLPEPGTPPEPRFPELQETTLSNGLNVILARRSAVPVVNFNLVLNAGYAADQHEVPGTASLAMDMLDEGTKGRSALEISEELDLLGARLSAESSLDTSSVVLSALKANLDASLDIYADVILNPVFPEADFKRLQKQQIARIQREKNHPTQMALRVFPVLLYGGEHPYGIPFTGSGYEQSVMTLAPEDLKRFHETWFKPNHATLIVVGDTTLEEVKPKLEERFRDWNQGAIPEKKVSEAKARKESMVYIMDRPGAQQSMVFVGHMAPPTNNPHEIAIEMMNAILGGTFTSRINMNLREDKHWSYGARSFFYDARGPRPFVVYAGVQTDKTKESMHEILKELRAIGTTEPPTADELEKVKRNRVLRLPGSWETLSEVDDAIKNLVEFDLPMDYYDAYPERVRGMQLRDVRETAEEFVHADQLLWVVAGDRSRIESEIRELNLGPIQLIDADGKPME